TCMPGPEGAPVQQCTGATRLMAVMAGVLAQHRAEVRLVVDQHPVSALGSCGAYPSLGIAVRARCLRRGLHYLHALAAEDLVEGSPGTLRALKTLSPRCGCGRKACCAW